MSITFTNFGKGAVTERYAIKAESTDPSIERARVTIYDKDDNEVDIMQHDPDLGTSDEFTFYFDSLARDFYSFDFYDLSIVTAQVGDLQHFEYYFQEDTGGPPYGAFYLTEWTPYNYTFNNFELEDFTASDYACGSTGDATKKFLTSAPFPKDLRVGDSDFIAIQEFSRTGANPDQEFVIERYDANSVLLATNTFDCVPTDYPIQTRTVELARNNYLRVDMPLTTAYNLVYIRDKASPFTRRSETKRYNNSGSCPGVRIHWLNEFGHQDSHTFYGATIKGIMDETKYYKKVRPVNPLTSDVGDIAYQSRYNEMWQINSISEKVTVIEWLRNIFRNKRVAIEVDGKYYPIIMESDDFTYYDQVGVVMQMSINFKFANDSIGLK